MIDNNNSNEINGDYTKKTPDPAPLIDISEPEVVIPKTESVDNMRVLLVEDDPLLRNLLSMKLQKSEISHTFCNSGLEAMDMVKEYDPTVIILDLMLPGKNGLEVLKEIREDSKYKETPVVIFSNKDDDSDRATAHDLGVEHFLIKATTDLSELLSLIIKLDN